MFRSRDIRILQSVHLITGPDPAPDPALFVIDFQDAKKKRFFSDLFCLLLSVGTLTSVFKVMMSLRSHYTAEIKVVNFLCLLMEGSESGAGSVPNNYGSGSRRPENIPVPEH